MSSDTLRILAVEDSPADFRLLKELLKHSVDPRFEVTGVETLEEGIKSLRAGKFDLVMLDLDLPDSRGLETLKRMRDARPPCPIVVLTGLTDEEIGIKALAMNAQDYLVKGRAGSDSIVRCIRYSIQRYGIERALHESEERLRVAMESIPDAMVIIDDQRSIMFVNEAVTRAAGQPADHFIGKRYEDAWPEDLSRVALPQIQSVYEAGETRSFEVSRKTPSGATRSFTVSLVPIKDAEGRVSQVMVIARDITDFREAEAVLRSDKEAIEKIVEQRTEELISARVELEQSKRLSDVGTLAAIVAHELRNPLASISLASENIRRKAQNPILDKHIATIGKKVAESEEIINNLLFYTRIKPPRREDVGLTDLLDECIGALKEQGSKTVSVTKLIRFRKGLRIQADPLQMAEVFRNILNNARDAVSDGVGRIEITGEDESGLVKISIMDNGIGMDEEVLKRAFDPFFTTKVKGTGLGLSVCRQMVDLHGGSMHIESEIGKGTVVTVRLPKTAGRRGSSTSS